MLPRVNMSPPEPARSGTSCAIIGSARFVTRVRIVVMPFGNIAPRCFADSRHAAIRISQRRIPFLFKALRPGRQAACKKSKALCASGIQPALHLVHPAKHNSQHNDAISRPNRSPQFSLDVPERTIRHDEHHQHADQ
jgi:hypothetical protein